MRLEGLPSGKDDLDIMLSSICVCTTPIDFNCTSHDLGATFPGQTLTVTLIVP